MKNDAALNSSNSQLNRSKNLSIPQNQSISSPKFSSNKFQGIKSAKQSPKIISGKLRDASCETSKLFSCLDIPIEKIARGTKVPAQYQRPTTVKEQNFNRTAMTGFFSKNQNKDLCSPKNEINDSNENEQETFNKLKENSNEQDIVKIKKLTNIEIPNSFHTMQNGSSKVNDQKPFESAKQFQSTSRDKWMPNKYREFERLVKTAHSRRDTHSNLPEVDVKQIKSKMQESDIFFLKDSNGRKDNISSPKEHLSKTRAKNFQESDIFMIKNNKIAIDKNGEKYLNIDSKKKFNFNTWSQSNSEWSAHVGKNSLLNHGSVQYHLLNPNLKAISKTKEIIFAESKSELNPVHRQKSLCEFLDLTRVGVPNTNKLLVNTLKNSKNIYNKESNICSSYLDIHRLYRGISEKPFMKKII